MRGTRPLPPALAALWPGLLAPVLSACGSAPAAAPPGPAASPAPLSSAAPAADRPPPAARPASLPEGTEPELSMVLLAGSRVFVLPREPATRRPAAGNGALVRVGQGSVWIADAAPLEPPLVFTLLAPGAGGTHQGDETQVLTARRSVLVGWSGTSAVLWLDAPETEGFRPFQPVLALRGQFPDARLALPEPVEDEQGLAEARSWVQRLPLDRPDLASLQHMRPFAGVGLGFVKVHAEAERAPGAAAGPAWVLLAFSSGEHVATFPEGDLSWSLRIGSRAFVVVGQQGRLAVWEVRAGRLEPAGTIVEGEGG